ncbi:MAG: SRPBCC family protein [Pseudomonadota bacterium]
MTPPEVRVVTQTVDASAEAVYAYASAVENLPAWASGLATGLTKAGSDWFAESPMGRVKVSMTPLNDLGVLDHDVTVPDGTTVHNAFRVTPAGAGAVLTFTLVRQPGVGDDEFERDAAHVAKDLGTLKALMERR